MREAVGRVKEKTPRRMMNQSYLCEQRFTMDGRFVGLFPSVSVDAQQAGGANASSGVLWERGKSKLMLH